MRSDAKLKRLKAAWARVFDGPDGELIAADLARVCKFKSPFDENPIVMARRVGRGEVLTHIQTMAGLSDRQITRMLEVETDADLATGENE